MVSVKDNVIFLCGNGNADLSAKILTELGELFGEKLNFTHINFNKHPEGELDNQIVGWDKIAGKTVIFFQSTYQTGLIEEALDMIWACAHQYDAEHIIGVFPFMWHRRQDPVMIAPPGSKKKAKPFEVQRLRQNFDFLKCAGLDEIIVATPHSKAMAQFAESSEIIFHDLDVSPLIANKIATFISAKDMPSVRIYSPDAGSIERAVNVAKLLHCPVIFNTKERALNDRTSIVSEDQAEIEELEFKFQKEFSYQQIFYATVEEVKDFKIVMVEDEAASCGTANDTGRKLKNFGARDVYFFTTHAVLTFGWRKKLFFENPFTKIIMTDTIPRGNDKRTGGQVVDASVSQLFASKIFQILSH